MPATKQVDGEPVSPRTGKVILPEHTGAIPPEVLDKFAGGRRSLAELMARLYVKGELPPLVFPTDRVPTESELLEVLEHYKGTYRRNIPGCTFHRNNFGKPADVVVTQDEQRDLEVVGGLADRRWGTKVLGRVEYRLEGVSDQSATPQAESPPDKLYVVYVLPGDGERVQKFLRSPAEKYADVLVENQNDVESLVNLAVLESKDRRLVRQVEYHPRFQKLRQAFGLAEDHTIPSIVLGPEPLLRRALKVAPNDPIVNLNLGILLLSQDSFLHNGSLNHLNEAVRLMPDSPKALLHRGNAHFKFDNPDRAIEDYEGVLRLNPDNNAAKENLQKARDKVTFLKREFGL